MLASAERTRSAAAELTGPASRWFGRRRVTIRRPPCQSRTPPGRLSGSSRPPVSFWDTAGWLLNEDGYVFSRDGFGELPWIPDTDGHWFRDVAAAAGVDAT